ncbi:MarR family transcriptional regulator [Streptomyces sp. CA-106110]|uniref:MarR family transcriptional regulator n=1 Tax=Streptomyces sp. CA-106110 TaxID=3240044 RepID=UPI003D8AA6AC
MRGGRRIALTAIRLSLPCSAGVRFLPGLKAGASSEKAGELATRTGLTTGATTRLIDRLERAGYARRTSRPPSHRQGPGRLHPRVARSALRLLRARRTRVSSGYRGDPQDAGPEAQEGCSGPGRRLTPGMRAASAQLPADGRKIPRRSAIAWRLLAAGALGCMRSAGRRAGQHP